MARNVEPYGDKKATLVAIRLLEKTISSANVIAEDKAGE